jgi:hypothetical protein
MFGEITKVEAYDDGTIRIVGVASTGAVDDADETVLPDAMKAALPAYMRFGALREMHGMTAAGATLSAQVDEEGVTRIEAHVVDPLAVKKVQLGVYKGFSIGGIHGLCGAFGGAGPLSPLHKAGYDGDGSTALSTAFTGTLLAGGGGGALGVPPYTPGSGGAWSGPSGATGSSGVSGASAGAGGAVRIYTHMS